MPKTPEGIVLRNKNGRFKKGCLPLSWKGGRYINDQGYVYVLSKNHPYRTCNGYVREHRLVMEKKLGRLLNPKEIVHHKNGVRTDNRIDNLTLCTGNWEHSRLERKVRKLSERDVYEIKELLHKVPIYQIAKIFNVSRPCIDNIRDGLTWIWVK